jgi:hypothetical protein
VSSTPWPATYEIRVDSLLDGRWADWFAGLRINNDGAQTVLTGTLQDQSALHGLLGRIHTMGLSVIAVRRLPADDERGDLDDANPDRPVT